MSPVFDELLLQEVGTSHEPTIGSKGHSLWNLPGDAHLPGAMEHVYNDLVEGGHPTGGLTYRLAVGIVKNWAHGKGVKKKETIAKAQAAVAQWEALRAKAHAAHAAKGAAHAVSEALPEEASYDPWDEEEHALVAAMPGAEKQEALDSIAPDSLGLPQAALNVPLAQAASRLLSGYTEAALNDVLGPLSPYLDSVIANVRGLQESDRTGRISEAWSDAARVAAAAARREHGSGLKKNYYLMQNVGQARHVINFHDGVKTHGDGSPFYDIHIASNKRHRDAFVADLRRKGYVERGDLREHDGSTGRIAEDFGDKKAAPFGSDGRKEKSTKRADGRKKKKKPKVEEDWSDRARIAAANARHLRAHGHHVGFDGRGVAVIPAGRINPHGGAGAPHSDFADRQHTIVETETGGRQSISGGWGDVKVGHKVDLVHDQTRRSLGRHLRVVGIRHADGRVEGEVPNKSIPHKALK